MKIFYDTEFDEDGSTIDLISIGMVREDGKELYRVCNEFDWDRARRNEWLCENVFPHLPTYKCGEFPVHIEYNDPCVAARWKIAADVFQFITETPNVELWAYYAAYDHVALAQLWGRMINLPKGVPMFTRDLKQEIERIGIVAKEGLPKQVTGEHNALADARHNLAMYRHIEKYL